MKTISDTKEQLNLITSHHLGKTNDPGGRGNS